MREIWRVWNKISLIQQIVLGLVIGIVLGVFFPKQLSGISLLGELFVGALKAVAPVLVLFLVMAAIVQHKSGQKTNMKSIIVLYLIGTFLASLTAVIASFIFKVKLILTAGATDMSPPEGLIEVLKTLLLQVIDNPLNAIITANYIGILAWGVLLGIAFKHTSDQTKSIISDIAAAISQVVKWVIHFAPFGVMGLVFASVATTGLSALKDYFKIIALLVGVMVFVALVVNPLIVYVKTRKNPYPLVFRCLKDSGITAFFTRSSAANIPVNMNLCEKLKLDKDTYSISIPLGATINMGGAAVTIAVLSLAAAYTLGISVDFPTAVILSLLATLSACGASGVAGGSLLLIPLACSLFGIPNDIAMQVVGIGFNVGVIQDSWERGLKSSTDVLFTSAAEIAAKNK